MQFVLRLFDFAAAAIMTKCSTCYFTGIQVAKAPTEMYSLLPMTEINTKPVVAIVFTITDKRNVFNNL